MPKNEHDNHSYKNFAKDEFLHNLATFRREQAMYYFGLVAHSSGSSTHLFSSSTLEEAIAMFFTHCIKNTYTANDAHLRLIKWSSMNFTEIDCFDKELLICGFNLQPENYL